MNIHAVGVHTARPAEGGCTRGVSGGRFETPLVGRAACFWRRGGNPPAPAFPRRGKRERGRSNLLAAAGICLRITPEYRPLTPSPQALTATQEPEFPTNGSQPRFWISGTPGRPTGPTVLYAKDSRRSHLALTRPTTGVWKGFPFA